MTPDATLIASELVSNAVSHARSVVRLSLARSPRVLRIEAHDTDRARPQPRDAERSDTAGRGMAIVKRLSLDTGTHVHARGKIIWAELARL